MLWSLAAGDPIIEPAARTAGRLGATMLAVLVTHRLGWLRASRTRVRPAPSGHA